METADEKKLIKVGERRVTAEVLNTDRKGFVCLSVCKCEILANLRPACRNLLRKGRASGGRVER
jgi:hypothetical protein